MYSQFKKCIEEKNENNNKELISILLEAQKKCTDKDFSKDIIADIIYACNDIEENLSKLDVSYLDPSYPALINLIQLWMKDSHDSLEIWHPLNPCATSASARPRTGAPHVTPNVLAIINLFGEAARTASMAFLITAE